MGGPAPWLSTWSALRLTVAVIRLVLGVALALIMHGPAARAQAPPDARGDPATSREMDAAEQQMLERLNPCCIGRGRQRWRSRRR